MNKNINLVDILKNCPKGTKLYSTVHGEVEFCKITDNNYYPISFSFKNKYDDQCISIVTADGKHCFNTNGECVLFPSKDQRDWSKFNINTELIDGEIYYIKTKMSEWIYIYRKNHTYKTMHYAAILNNYLIEFNNICTTHNKDIKLIRKATEKEKLLLFEMIEKNGRKWDADKKELVKIEPKFNISTLRHFDKVLVRDYDKQMWKCDFYNSHVKELNTPFRTISSWYKQCIPYNEETKHLVDTNEMPPKKYIIWEE